MAHKELNPFLKEIVVSWLNEHKYDGLFHDDCACPIDDLFPCSEPSSFCEAGYRQPCDGTCDEGKCDFHIGRVKPEEDFVLESQT